MLLSVLAGVPQAVSLDFSDFSEKYKYSDLYQIWCCDNNGE
jgi:hypothetical protein